MSGALGFARRLRRARGLILLALVGAGAGAGCCAVQKSPGRCAACVYDNCIVPYGSRATLPPPALTAEAQAPRERGASPMAY